MNQLPGSGLVYLTDSCFQKLLLIIGVAGESFRYNDELWFSISERFTLFCSVFTFVVFTLNSGFNIRHFFTSRHLVNTQYHSMNISVWQELFAPAVLYFILNGKEY